MSVKLNSTGGGSVTLDSPSTASNYTVTLPSAAGTLATTTGTGSVFTNPTINGFTGDTSAITVGTTQFVKDTSGNIGIGTGTPVSKFDVRGNIVTAGDGTTAGVALRSTSGRDSYGIFNVNESSSSSALGVYWVDGNADPSGGTERLRLDSSGNLGLGVTPSTSWQSTRRILQVGGSAALWATSGSAGTLFLSNNTYYDGTNFRYLNTSGASYIAQQTDGSYSFNQAASGTAGNPITFNQAMTLDAGGNLTLGTSSIAASPAEVVRVQGAGSTNKYCYWAQADVSVYTGYALRVYSTSNSAVVGSINFTTSTTTYSPSSDISLKENIKPITNGLERVSKLKPVDYNWKSDGVLDNGFIAQDLLATEEFAHRCNAIETKEDGTKVYGVDYMKFVAVLTAAIQELSAQNQALEVRLAQLEAK